MIKFYLTGYYVRILLELPVKSKKYLGQNILEKNAFLTPCDLAFFNSYKEINRLVSIHILILESDSDFILQAIWDIKLQSNMYILLAIVMRKR